MERYGESRIYIAYLITFIIILSGAIPFFYKYLQVRCCQRSHDMKAPQATKKRPESLPTWLKFCLLVLLSLLMLTYCAIEDTFSGFLATFCVDYLHWGKDVSSYATSLHWGAFCIGRFLGIVWIKFFRPVQLLCAFLILLILSFVCLFISSLTMTNVCIWIFIPACGFSMSIVFPCIFQWTEESILEVTGKISSMFLVSASAGLLCNPVLVGYLMKNLGPISFMYIQVSECFLCFGLFLLVWYLVNKYIKRPRRDMEIVIPPPEELQPFEIKS